MSTGRRYWRIMLGAGHAFAAECHEGGWFGVRWVVPQDLTEELTDDWRDFNRKFIPVYLQANPGKSRVLAGGACGSLYTVCKEIRQGDIVLAPDGKGAYWSGTVTSDYCYAPDHLLAHRRKVEWRPGTIARSEMSEALQRSVGNRNTLVELDKHEDEIEGFLAGADELVEDPSVFALEKHLEDFLVQNWDATELGKDYKIYEDEGKPVGQQYQADTGRIDILAERRDGKEILVIELKKGRASDAVVGQVQCYMGYVLDELAEPGQTVRGCIIALEDNARIKRALRVAPNIDFYRYQVDFKLFKV